MVWLGLDGVPCAVPVSEVLVSDPGRLSAGRIGILPTAARPSGDQPTGAWLALNIRSCHKVDTLTR